EEALRLASERRSAIEYDPVAEAPFFVYYEREGGRDIKHVVWFESARSVGATGRLADELSSRGISIWNVMKFFPRMFLQLDSMFDIL
ncbi:MAG: spore gernimation protein, partial [Clostridia bacterium]|nr:spore gernimation protein [Clostridia bacterium]